MESQRDSQGKEESLQSMNKDVELLEKENSWNFSKSKPRSSIKRVYLNHSAYLKVKPCQADKNCIHDSVFRSNPVLDYQIPKHIVTIDEKYLRCCLELIHISASKPAPANLSMNLSSTGMSNLFDNLNSSKSKTINRCDLDRSVSARSVVVSPKSRWIIGTVMGSKSMINILKSPSNSRKLVKGLIGDDVRDSPDGARMCSSPRLEKATPTRKSHKCRSNTAHKRLVSLSTTDSSSPDRSSYGSRGMLQCAWKHGIPHFSFSADDQMEVYVANSLKVESKDKKALDYVYLFHSGKFGEKDCEILDGETRLVGKMKVSTSFTVGPNQSEIMETEFVLFGGVENSEIAKDNSSSSNLRRSSELSKSKKRNTQSFSGLLDKINNRDTLHEADLLEYIPPNFQLAAIVVKEPVSENHHKESVWGWGLNFLKKVEVEEKNDFPGSLVQSEFCARDSGFCSTSMDVLIPSGLHGGPRMRNCGPSSLVERWRSRGQCDCGGWDIGCPLRVLTVRTSKDGLAPDDLQGECRSFDLHVQGSEGGPPSMRMVNVRDGLYFIHFEPSLTSLQSFSIAVAVLHSRNPTLKPRSI